MHPILFQFGENFFISTYGLMIAIGLVAAIALASWRGRSRGFPPDVFMDIAFVGVVSGFISARLLYIALNLDEFQAHPFRILFGRAGFVFLGGFVGAVACTILYIKHKKRLPVLPLADVAVASIALAHAFGRIGCHLVGCCWGAVCEVPKAGIRLERHLQPGGEFFVNAYEYQLYEGIITSDALKSLPVWPVQLMESAGLFILVGILLLFGRKPRPPGQSLALYLMLYSLLRFSLEFLRGDAERGLFFGGAISTSQIISLALVPVGIGIWVYSRRQPVSPYGRVTENETT